MTDEARRMGVAAVHGDDRIRWMEEVLSQDNGKSVIVKITDNSKIMVSVGRQREGLVFRLHHMFLVADEGILWMVGDYLLRHDPHARRVVNRYVRAHEHLIRGSVKLRPRSLLVRGQVYDLRQIFDEVRQAHFPNEPRLDGVVIGWGPLPINRGGRSRRSIKLGTINDETGLIKIHPALDQNWIPRFFVASIVFHEMLHAVIPAVRRGRRRLIHPLLFRQVERRHPDYQRACEWERQFLGRLLRWQPSPADVRFYNQPGEILPPLEPCATDLRGLKPSAIAGPLQLCFPWRQSER